MLSKTELKNGTIVENAIVQVAVEKDGVSFGYFTLGEVARASGKSRKTVEKYVSLLIAHNAVEEINRDMRYCSRNTTRSFKWLGTLISSV